MNIDEYRVAKWIAHQTYIVDGQAKRTLIYNERDREYLILEEASAVVWNTIAQADRKVGAELLSRLNIPVEELDNFLSELNYVGALVSDITATAPTSLLNTETVSTVSDDGKLERDFSDWAFANGFLFTAHFEITYRCNERCVHCFNPGAAYGIQQPKRERSELTTSECFALIDDLQAVGVFDLTISGGEVTLRPDLVDIVAYARQKGLRVCLFTNGLKLTDALIDKLRQLWVHTIEVSVYSSDATKHEAITRVPGSHASTVDAMRRLVKAGVQTKLKSIQMDATVSGFRETEEFGESLGVSVEIETVLSPNVDGRTTPLSHQIEFNSLVALAATPGSPIYVGTAETNWGRRNLEAAREHAVCGAGRKRLNINPEGVISPCSVLPKEIGHVKGKGLRDAWQTSIAKATNAVTWDNISDLKEDQFLSAWQSVVLKNFDECGTHDRCAWCVGMCPGDAMLQTGNPLAAAANHCRQSAARMEAVRLLMDGLSQKEIYDKLKTSDHDVGAEVSIGKTKFKVIPLKPVD